MAKWAGYAYLTDEYFEMYGCILETAKELGMTVVFYDDCDFPISFW